MDIVDDYKKHDCRIHGHGWVQHPDKNTYCCYCDAEYDSFGLFTRIVELEKKFEVLQAALKEVE